MTLFSSIHLASLEFEDDNLVHFSLFSDGSNHASPIQSWLSQVDHFLIIDQKNLVEAHLLPYVCIQALYINEVPFADSILLTTTLNNGV